MSEDQRDKDVFEIEDGAPSATHDRAIENAIDAAGDRIKSRRARKSWVKWILVPTAIAASVFLVPFLMIDPSDQLRNSGSETAVVPANASELLAAPTKLRWQPQSGAAGYRVILRNIESDILLTVEIEDPVTEFVLPNDVIAQLEPGETYYWSVTVNESLRQELGPYWFTLRENRH